MASNHTAAQSETLRLLGSLAIVVIVIVIGVTLYTIRNRDAVASQAIGITQTFIKASPVVETDLGPVVAIKEDSEKRVDGRGWMVDYTVRGKKAQADVDFVVKKSDGRWGSWQFVQANLKTSKGKTSDLL